MRKRIDGSDTRWKCYKKGCEPLTSLSVASTLTLGTSRKQKGKTRRHTGRRNRTTKSEGFGEGETGPETRTRDSIWSFLM